MNRIELVCTELGPALDLLRSSGLRLDSLYPADDPHTAILAGDDVTIRLTCRPDAPAPGDGLPAFDPHFVFNRSGGSAVEGRAGMLYRDLIPGRLGGRYIASHITIPDGGPVADWVHYHRVAFQVIVVRRGWVKVVYEDQGAPFVMNDGDLVLQPPEIRHRVLENSPGLEVVEISCPAVHSTFAEHELELPNGGVDRSRNFSGQHFLHHVASETPWTGFLDAQAQETMVDAATGGLAQVRTIGAVAGSLTLPAHDGELVFGFVLDGSARLDFRGEQAMAPGDAFVIPPGEEWGIGAASADFRLLHVTTARLDD